MKIYAMSMCSKVLGGSHLMQCPELTHTPFLCMRQFVVQEVNHNSVSRGQINIYDTDYETAEKTA